MWIDGRFQCNFCDSATNWTTNNDGFTRNQSKLWGTPKRQRRKFSLISIWIAKFDSGYRSIWNCFIIVHDILRRIVASVCRCNDEQLSIAWRSDFSNIVRWYLFSANRFKAKAITTTEHIYTVCSSSSGNQPFDKKFRIIAGKAISDRETSCIHLQVIRYAANRSMVIGQMGQQWQIHFVQSKNDATRSGHISDLSKSSSVIVYSTITHVWISTIIYSHFRSQVWS